MQTASHIFKKFETTERLDMERQGHRFFNDYYPKVPPLLAVHGKQIVYRDMCYGGAQVVSDCLNRGECVSLESTFSMLATITREYSKKAYSEGGTKLFYIDRAMRLYESGLHQLYIKWQNQIGSNFKINDHNTPVNQYIFNHLISWKSRISYCHVTPSQGDLHERNILTNGTIIDFEGSGYNMVATDIATFVWHTLFAGNHFGPLYSKWSDERSRVTHRSAPSTFSLDFNNLTITIQGNRSNLFKQYSKYYIQSVKHPELNQADISNAIAFRLLTTFDVKAMSQKDIHISFMLANFFIDPLSTFDEKLDIII